MNIKQRGVDDTSLNIEVKTRFFILLKCTWLAILALTQMINDILLT